MRGTLEVELDDEAGEPGLRLSAKHGFVEAAGLKTIGLDLALVADPTGVWRRTRERNTDSATQEVASELANDLLCLSRRVRNHRQCAH
jgi:hypothetical protein